MNPTFQFPADLFLANLSPTDSATPLRLEQAVREAAKGGGIVPCTGVDLDEYSRLGHCTFQEECSPQPVRLMYWGGEDDDRLISSHEQVVWSVDWGDKRLWVVKATWQTSCGGESRYWIVAGTQEIAESFLLDVDRKTNDPGESILVFHDGYWQRSREMWRATRDATFDDLVLAGTLKDTIREDCRRFLNARTRYESLGVAWRRGALLIGPPGNGKTHCVRALVNELNIPSLYVQNLSHPHYTSEQLLRDVFDRARKLRPCMLIFEDLDALVNNENRSVFLNQLDGFEKNVGMLVVATTNHPERIDPAILDRPSRFDRKYHFGLPELSERISYLAHWHSRLVVETGWTRESVEHLAAQSAGFSFAYLKELIVSGLLRWMAEPGQEFGQVLNQQCGELRTQMGTTQPVSAM
ncbi:MAG: ATP-binding protein [Pirellulales bacterium]